MCSLYVYLYWFLLYPLSGLDLLEPFRWVDRNWGSLYSPVELYSSPSNSKSIFFVSSSFGWNSCFIGSLTSLNTISQLWTIFLVGPCHASKKDKIKYLRKILWKRRISYLLLWLITYVNLAIYPFPYFSVLSSWKDNVDCTIYLIEDVDPTHDAKKSG